jgi:hypothetical protein
LGEAISNSADTAEAMVVYSDALDRVTALRNSRPDSPALRYLAAEANKFIAGSHVALGHWTEAEASGMAFNYPQLPKAIAQQR